MEWQPRAGSARGTRRFPERPDGHIPLGQLFRARGEPKWAAQHLRLAAAACRALSADPDMPNSLDAEAGGLDPRT
jgi:hypothetical protein